MTEAGQFLFNLYLFRMLHSTLTQSSSGDGLRLCWLYSLQRSRGPSKKGGVLGMTLNCI